jgi:arsenite methyltransferase
MRRQGGATIPPNMLSELQRYRNRVLDNAAIQPGNTVLDVGCGDGLIGFGALERADRKGHVIFSDLSSDLVARCKATAQQLDHLDRCRFVVNPADDLHDIADASVDVVTTRSVLIYVDRKDRAFAEFS